MAYAIRWTLKRKSGDETNYFIGMGLFGEPIWTGDPARAKHFKTWEGARRFIGQCVLRYRGCGVVEVQS